MDSRGHRSLGGTQTSAAGSEADGDVGLGRVFRVATWEEDRAGSNADGTEGGGHECEFDQQPMRHDMV